MFRLFVEGKATRLASAIPSAPTIAIALTCALGVTGLLACTTASGAADTTSSELVTDVESMVRRPDGRYDVVCRDGRRMVVTAADVLANQVCGGGATPGRVAIYGRSDRCDDRELVASVDEDTNCDAFSSSSPAWSIRDEDGVCQDIRDTNVRDACRTYTGRRPRSDLDFYSFQSAGCMDSRRIGSIRGDEPCDVLPDDSHGPFVGEIKSDWGCGWSAQVTMRRACELFREREDRR